MTLMKTYSTKGKKSCSDGTGQLTSKESAKDYVSRRNTAQVVGQ